MTDHTAIITGATGGLGYECARALLERGDWWHVVLAVRDAERGRDAAARLGAPARSTVLRCDLASLDCVRSFVAECRAAELHLPLVWPDRFPAGVPGALRAAVRAGEVGAGARFGLAAIRLAFCGGFDLEDPEDLAEAAAAAGVALDDCLAAAGDRSLDATIEATARGLAARGVTQLPTVRFGRQFQEGERGLTETAAPLQARAVSLRPLAPVG